MRTWGWWLVIVFASGCLCGGDSVDDGGVSVDAGAVDAGVVDAGVVDAGAVDAGDADAGVVDAGVVDAGAVDAGVVDAGADDAGLTDAGPVDAGEVDAGCGSGFHICGSTCVADDPTQCGGSCSACAAATPGSFTRPTCELGVCGFSCVDLCGTSCVNRQVDPLNCGSCGNACASDQRCSRGRCVTPCPNGIDFEGQIPLWAATFSQVPEDGVIQVADLNGDGINDLYNPIQPKGYFHFGTPSARGVGRGRFVTGPTSPDLAADLDQDGKLESIFGTENTTTRIEWIDGGVVSLTTPTAHRIRVAHGNIFEASPSGLGILALNGSWSWLITGEDVVDFLVQDLDLDGLDDFIVRTGPPWQMTLRHGLSDGGVGAPSLLDTPNHFGVGMSDLALVDINSDGRLDIMSQTAAYFGLSDGGFELHDLFTTGPGVPFDVDGDGRKEWVHAWARVLNAVWFEPDGGTRRTPLPLFADTAPFDSSGRVKVQRLGVGDVNNDGVEDLVYQAQDGSGSAHLGGTGGLVFPPSFSSSFFVLADVTLDGFPDLVLPGAVWVNDGAGHFEAPMSAPTGAEAMIASDLNADGISDIIQSDRIFMSQGAAFSSVQIIPSGSPTATADFDRDGRMDILQVFPHSSTGRVLFQQPDAGFAIGPVIAMENPAVADVDVDGWPDLLFVTNGWADNTRGTFVERPIADCYQLETFADFDKDGVVDLGCRSMTNQWLFLHGSGNGSFAAAAPITFGRPASGYATAVGDFDGDGNLDLSYAYGLVHPGRGDGTFAAPELWAPFDSAARVPTVADIDGDGRDDLILSWDPTANGKIYVLRSVCR